MTSLCPYQGCIKIVGERRDFGAGDISLPCFEVVLATVHPGGATIITVTKANKTILGAICIAFDFSLLRNKIEVETLAKHLILNFASALSN